MHNTYPKSKSRITDTKTQNNRQRRKLYPVLRPPFRNKAAIGGTDGNGGLKGIMTELAKHNGLRKVRQAGGSIRIRGGGATAATASNGGLRIPTGAEIGVVEGSGGSGIIVVVVVVIRNDENAGLGKA